MLSSARLLFAVLVVLSCGLQPARAQAGRPEQAPAALRLDGEAIPLDVYARWLVKNFGERAALTFGLEFWAVEREARALGVEVPDAEVSKRVDGALQERIEKAFLGRKSEWLAELQRTRRTEAGVRLQRAMEDRPLALAERMAAIDRVVPEQKIVRDWEFQYGRKGRRYELHMTKVLVVVPSGERQSRDEWNAGREKVMEEGRRKALAIRDRIAAGEDFGKVARETSDDPETRDGRGQWTRGFSHFGWPWNFLEALEKLAEGELSEPLYARGGWWIVRVDAVHETPLAAVHEEIRARLERKGPEPDEAGAVLERIRAATTVRILPAMYDEGSDPELQGPNQPVLEVDGEPVPRATFARWLVATQGESMMQRFVEDWAIERKAREVGVAVTPEEVDERVLSVVQSKIDEGHKGTREAWVAFLALRGRTEESALRAQRERTRTDLLAEKLLLRERKVTPDDVRLRFRSEFGADGERLEARWIVVMNSLDAMDAKWTREQLTEALDKASRLAGERAGELVARARAGEDFAALARTHSDDAPTKAGGGRIPGRFVADLYPDRFGAAVANLAVGEVSEPLDYGNAWVIFQVTARRTVTFEDVEKELAAELAAQRPSGAQVNAHRNSLTQKMAVEILPGMASR